MALSLIEQQFALTRDEVQMLVDSGMMYHPLVKPQSLEKLKAIRDVLAPKLTRWDSDALKDKNVPFGKRRPLL